MLFSAEANGINLLTIVVTAYIFKHEEEIAVLSLHSFYLTQSKLQIGDSYMIMHQVMRTRDEGRIYHCAFFFTSTLNGEGVEFAPGCFILWKSAPGKHWMRGSVAPESAWKLLGGTDFCNCRKSNFGGVRSAVCHYYRLSYFIPTDTV